MKEFTVGNQYVIDGKVRKVTKVNSKSVYFGRVRFDIQMDEERDTQFIQVNDWVYYADDIYNPETGKVIINAEETATEINEEEITMTENKNITAENEVVETATTETEVVETPATETAKSEAPKYTEYVVMKADQKDTVLWWDIVRKAKGENISDIINPLHEEDNPKFVALVAIDKIKKYLDDPTIKGMVQTVRDVTKKYAKVVGVENPTAGQVFADIIAELTFGATEGCWNAPKVAEENTNENGAA